MRTNGVTGEKSYKYALRIIKLYQLLSTTKKEFVLSKQILRCGTSIGANIREAIHAESKADFIHKMSIALKESCETEYWLNLMKDSELIDMATFESYENDCVELIKLTTAIIKTSKRNKK